MALRLVPARADDVKGKLEILHCGGGLRLHDDPLGRDAVGDQPVVHGLGFGDLLALAHAAGDDGDGLRMLVQILQRPLEPPHQGQRGLILVYRSAQHNEVIPPRVLVGAGVFDDEILHKAEISETDTGQNHHHAPEGDGQIPVQHKQRGDEQQRVAPPGVAPQRKAQKQARGT